MKIHIISETAFTTKGNGVHTAFLDLIELLNEKNDVGIIVNGEGVGDIFHSHTYGPYYFWKGRNYKGKRILTAHVIPDSIKGSLPMWKLLMPLIKWYFKKVYSYADVCIALSPMVEKAIRSLGVKTRIVRIYNPINIEQWKRSDDLRKKERKILGLSEKDFVVLGVGQLEGRKGVEDFLDVAEAIPEMKFVWAGGRPFGIFTEGITRINAKAKRTSGNVQFTGMLDLKEMPAVYAAADMLLFPSYQENCPLAPIEAAASGIPVIFRDIEEYRLLYKNFYLKASTTPEFINLTKKLRYDKIFYEKGQKISKMLVTQFEKNNIRDKLIHLYHELLYEKNPKVINFYVRNNKKKRIFNSLKSAPTYDGIHQLHS